MPDCRKCGQKIEFVVDENKKWVVVEPYTFDSFERQSRKERIPIPFDPSKHEKHVCSREQPRNYDKIYR